MSDNEGKTPIMLISGLGDAQTFGWIARNISKEALLAHDNKGCTLVYHAVKGGHIGIVEQAIEINGDGTCGQGGETPLHLAAASGNLFEVVKVDADVHDIIHRTALDYCMFSNNIESKDYLESEFGFSEKEQYDSSPRGTVQKWMDAISHSVGKPNLRLNSEGICAFTYEEYSIVLWVLCSFMHLSMVISLQ